VVFRGSSFSQLPKQINACNQKRNGYIWKESYVYIDIDTHFPNPWSLIRDNLEIPLHSWKLGHADFVWTMGQIWGQLDKFRKSVISKQFSSVPVLFRNFSHPWQNCPVHVTFSNFSEHYALRNKIKWLSFFLFWAVLFSCFLRWWISNLITGPSELWKPNWGGVWVGHF